MDKAKAAVSDFMSRSGHHDTTVHEAVAPAVVQETIKPHVHEEVNTAIDKEVHQDHYHRTIQPVQDREVLPETHTAKIGSVQHREFDHRDADTIKRNLVADQARFKDERRIEQTTQSQSVAPTVGGEHIHHHIHETIQPVVQKEVIQPTVVHTTVPIHEVHHNQATFHETTALPAMTMDQFKAKGGALSGREERYDEFEGVPKNIGGTAGGMGAVSGLEHKALGHQSQEHSRHGDYDGAANHHSAAGLRQGGLTHNSTTGRRGSSSSSSSDEERGTHRRTPLADRRNRHADRGMAGQGNMMGSSTQGGIVNRTGDRNHDGKVDSRDLTDSSRNQNIGATGSSTHKPSLMDKLNPKVDANGDGKPGFMK